MGNYKKAHIYLTSPNMHEHIRETRIFKDDHQIQCSSIKRVIEILEKNEYRKCMYVQDPETLQTKDRTDEEYSTCVDSVPGFWNLDRDWLVFTDECATDWGWVRPKSFCDDEWLELWEMLVNGRLIMMVFMVNEDGKVIPHC